MNSLFETFIKEYQASPLTKRTYRSALGLFDLFLAGAEPTERKVEQYMLSLEKKGLTSASISLYLSAIRMYFLWRKKKAPPEQRGNFDIMVTGPKVHKKLPRILPSEDVYRIVAACKNAYERALTMTLYDGALRINELMGLQVQDIDFRESQLRITRKGGDEAMLPVGDKTIQALKEYVGSRQGQVFPQAYWRLSYTLCQIANRVGVRKLHPHLLRHARAQDLRRQGVAIEDIQDFLGHKQIETTMRYARGDPRELKKKITRAF